ncbi:MAG TPA: hypothetical protein VM143_17360 [Acidimicrobiales bacterium]|nr:hypothetical protein [Acidimicrobiales bacterium]
MGSPVADSILRLQRDVGNRAVTEVLLQRDAKPPRKALEETVVPPAPAVPTIGPTPVAVNHLPKADANGGAQPLGETVVTSSTVPSLAIERVGETRKDGTYTSKVKPAGPVDIHLDAIYPAPNTYTLDKLLLLIEPAVADHIKAGEQEHSNDHYLAVHQVQGAVGAAIGRLAAQPPRTTKDLRAAWACWRARLDAELPTELRGGQANKVVDTLHALSNERDTKGWHNMIFRGPLQKQVRATKIPKGLELKRVYPSGNIGVEGSQERIDKAVPGLRKAKRR